MKQNHQEDLDVEKLDMVHLAEKALSACSSKSEEEFPYAIRTVSETFESNGSTSMASQHVHHAMSLNGSRCSN